MKIFLWVHVYLTLNSFGNFLGMYDSGYIREFNDYLRN